MSEMDVHATDDAVEAAQSPEAGALGIEAPEADAVEQHTALTDDATDSIRSIPFDVDEADAADQHRVVELDEDDYR